jgi:GNAT superfamily N-acetyltransferase
VSVEIAPLANHREHVPFLASWFVRQWPDWYGPGGRGDALGDLRAFAASASEIPCGLVVLQGNAPVGVGALKAESLPSHRHLGPWASAGFVLPSHRGRGHGAMLLRALVQHAGALGHGRVYCATATAESLLRRNGWSEVERVEHEGKPLTVFSTPAVSPAIEPDAWRSDSRAATGG